MTIHSSRFGCLCYLTIVIDQLEQCDRSESEYDYVRKDGIWGEEAALVGRILADSCDCRL